MILILSTLCHDRDMNNLNLFIKDIQIPGGGGGTLPSNGLLGMCRWMGSHFHDSTDYNGVAFSSIFNRVTRMGSHFFGTLKVRKSFVQK